MPGCGTIMQTLPPSALYAEKLLSWYDKNLRLLPWRITPQQQAQGIKAAAYRVWLAEVMLQQTTVEAVKPYFARFIAAWPNLAALSAASSDAILAGWAGLGYYSRARNLKACADKIMADYSGEFPRTAAELRRLPGIGDYTSAAIAAIAFDEPCAVIDANVERVIARLFCITTPLPAARKAIRSACQSLVPQDGTRDNVPQDGTRDNVPQDGTRDNVPQDGTRDNVRQNSALSDGRQARPINRAGDFAQAMMDLGATICTIKKPACSQCPLTGFCLARQNNMAASLPRKAPKPAREERCGAAFIALSATGKIYLQKRPAHGLLGGMSEVPNYFAKGAQIAPAKADLQNAPFAGSWRYQGKITHIFTHFHLTLAVYKAENITETAALLPAAQQPVPGFWVKTEGLAAEALPTVMKKAIAAALPTLFKKK
ncbi:MAG: A/G-specific adenine glycosylase [Candidatus Tokpelaia sp.]|nr:MAG: A/G-specific adenine glycosylase [Candidatus Tokpelaia sp.]